MPVVNNAPPYRQCDVYISLKYKHIMFVSHGRVHEFLYHEHEDCISDVWPCDFGKLHENIEVALERCKIPYLNYDGFRYGRGNYPSYNNSKAKSESSFNADYVKLMLETDLSRDYEIGEIERIKVTAQPSPLETTYYLTGMYHLHTGDMRLAQLVLDIYEACEKIRG